MTIKKVSISRNDKRFWYRHFLHVDSKKKRFDITDLYLKERKFWSECENNVTKHSKKVRKNQKKKKALCIIGARQIGKTTIIREFAKEQYEHFVEINFILDKGAEKIFEGKLDANTIIENLTAFKMKELEPGKTLIFWMRYRNVRMQDVQ